MYLYEGQIYLQSAPDNAKCQSMIISYCLSLASKSTPDFDNIPVNAGRKLNVHKKFRRRPGRHIYIQFTSCVYWDTLQ